VFCKQILIVIPLYPTVIVFGRAGPVVSSGVPGYGIGDDIGRKEVVTRKLFKPQQTQAGDFFRKLGVGRGLKSDRSQRYPWVGCRGRRTK